MIDRGDTTTRERDFADVALLTRRHKIDAQRLSAAITSTSHHRQSDLRPLAQVLNTLATSRQTNWDRYVKRAGLQGEVPEEYADTITAIIDFADPILTRTVRSGYWNPTDQRWTA